MKLVLAVLVILSCLWGLVALAQPSRGSAAAFQPPDVLPKGSKLLLRLENVVTGPKAHLQFMVVQDAVVNGYAVAPFGAGAVGQVESRKGTTTTLAIRTITYGQDSATTIYTYATCEVSRLSVGSKYIFEVR